MSSDTVLIRLSTLSDYQQCWQAMREFTDQRTSTTLDEIWVVEHLPVFTQGQNGKPEHLIHPGNIPVIQSDRGGQITYHGPGQLVVYPLIDLKRKKLNVREIVTILETSVIQLLQENFNITAVAKCDAPGVYIDNHKICSVGLRIRRGCSFHGLALNVDMDLEPFSRINPCGFSDLKMTQLKEFKKPIDIESTGRLLIEHLIKNLRYTTHHYQ
jgi:lipoyl(octanoyl) transferase